MAATATALRAAPAAARNVAIVIRGVSHAFELDGARLPVLESIDLSVAAGEFVALLGPSGCGKSTLLRLISGLEQPTSGSISAEGSLIDRPDPSRILVFQDPTLFPWATVWNNVAIDIRGVRHAFELDGSRLPVLESIDLSVAAGEFVALLGPSGCGKSTLLRLISGLEQPTSGSISAEGSLIDRPDPSRILVFQDPTLFP